MKVIRDKVLVLPLEKDKTKQVGDVKFTITEDRESTMKGKIVIVGPGKYENGKYEIMPVTEGDEILYRKFGVEKITLEDIEYNLISLEDILIIY